MPSPYERLDKLISAQVPSQVVFKVGKRQEAEGLSFEAVTVKDRSWIGDETDTELKAALVSEIEETWDPQAGKYYINASVDKLWSTIKRTILREYDTFSKRCAATKRKTEQFIRGINIDDKHLPNFLIQVFLQISSPAYSKKTSLECEALFEQFESLRRTYGKRS